MEQATLEIDNKQKALDKMLVEMNEKHTPTEDVIHNWLCDQEDEEMFKGILKKGRSIKGAVKYCATQAQKQKTGNVAMIDNETVYAWIRDYFVSNKTKKEKVDARVETSNDAESTKIKENEQENHKKEQKKKEEPVSRKRKTDPRDKKQKSEDKELQLSLFDSL